MKQPNLSVVTVCYNAVNDIGETTLPDINMARPLMVRQPYSVAVLSTGGRLHPRFLRKRGLGKKWSSPCRRDGEVEKSLL